MQTTTAVDQQPQQKGNLDDGVYVAFIERINDRFLRNRDVGPLFTTNVEGLWDIYLESFPEQLRQYHNCNACRHFIERFGHLVTIDESGIATPAFWNVNDADEDHTLAIIRIVDKLRRASVNGVFLSGESTWGQPVTGVWRHLNVTRPQALAFKSPTQSAAQAMAEKREDFKNVQRALEEFPLPLLVKARSILEADALYRSEKVLGPAKWLCDLQLRIGAEKGRRTNLVWRAVATAPAGFCHPRSSMIGTLLEDLAAGMSFDDVARRFRDKMHPLQYQRPQAAPSAGNIAQAEKLVAQLGIERSLKRRYARVEEIEALWRPAAEPERSGGGVFGHLKAKDTNELAPMNVKGPPMTFDKFRRTLMTTAKAIELYVPLSGSFAAILTAGDPDAPPILRWDTPERRNPFSWYLYHGGSPAAWWGLGGGWCEVTAVALRPPFWYGATSTHDAPGAFFILSGAKDQGRAKPGAGLFPEILKSDLRAVRATIEAYSQTAHPADANEASACGLAIQQDHCDVRLRVTDNAGTRVEVRLDRWD